MAEHRLMPVHVDVVKELLVDRILAQVLAREPPQLVPPVKQALEARLELPVCDGGPIDLRMRGIGYLTRAVEGDMFDSAREPMRELADRLRARIAEGEGWAAAATCVSGEYARSEPLPKPAPDDEHAVSWKVPGPGGHVRHYLVAAAIAEVLRGEGEGSPPSGLIDADQLKRCWTYGFVVACCEQGLSPAAESGA